MLRPGMPGREGFPGAVPRWWRWFLHLGLGVQAGSLVPLEDQAAVLGRTLSLRSLGSQSKALDASDSMCCQCSSVVRVQQPPAFALSPALPAAAPSFAQPLPRRLLNRVLERKFSLSTGGRDLS